MSSAATSKPKRAAKLGSVLERVPLDVPVVLLWVITLLLVGYGIVMVLSSSYVSSYLAHDGFLGGGIRHAVYAAVGLVAMVGAAFMKPALLRKLAPIIFFLAIGLQLLVFTPLGFEVWGNRNWISIAGATVQPSEPLKLALILMLGSVYMNQKSKPKILKYEVFPALVPWAVVAMLLVMLGHDFGTTIIMGMIVFGVLYFSDVSRGTLITLFLTASLFAFFAVISSENRIRRTLSLFSGGSDYTGTDWQPLHGVWALAGGGLFGAGLGESKAKWSWLPAADNDYIFAIIGEESGFIGAMFIILLYVLLAFTLINVISRARDRFSRGVLGGVLVWIVGQAFVNILVVLRLLPPLGVPLPLISSGGSSLVACMLAIGVVIAIAKDATKYQLENATS